MEEFASTMQGELVEKRELADAERKQRMARYIKANQMGKATTAPPSKSELTPSPSHPSLSTSSSRKSSHGLDGGVHQDAEFMKMIAEMPDVPPQPVFHVLLPPTKYVDMHMCRDAWRCLCHARCLFMSYAC